MVSDAEVKVRLKAEGAEETKQRILETRAALIGVSSGELEHAQSMRAAARDAQALNNAEAYQSRIFLAQHPALNSLTRGMREFGSASRGVLAITTAFSTAISAFNSTNSALSDTQAQLNQAEREQTFALKTYGYDSKEYADARDSVNALKSKMEELGSQKTTENLTQILNLGATVGILGSSMTKVIPKIAEFIPKIAALSGVFGSLGTSVLIAAGPILLIAAAIAGVAAAFYMATTKGDQVAEFMKKFFPENSRQIDDWSKNIDDVFTMHIPNAFIYMANGALGTFNLIVKGAEMMTNGVIGGINAIIAAVNKVASYLPGHMTIPSIPTVNFSSVMAQPIPYLSSRNWGPGGPGTYDGGYTGGGGVSRGAGAGDEMVTMSGSRGGGNQTIVVNMNIAGTVKSDQELKKTIDATLKDSLKKYGWT